MTLSFASKYSKTYNTEAVFDIQPLATIIYRCKMINGIDDMNFVNRI